MSVEPTDEMASNVNEEASVSSQESDWSTNLVDLPDTPYVDENNAGVKHC